MAEQVNEDEKLPLPEGWYVLWCPVCLASVSWTKEDMDTFVFEEWLETQSWFAEQVEHDMTRHAANE